MKKKHVIHFGDYWIDLSKVDCISDTFINFEDSFAYIKILIAGQSVIINLPNIDFVDKDIFEHLCKSANGYPLWKSISHDYEKVVSVLNAYNGYVFSELTHPWLTYDNNEDGEQYV